MKVEVRLRADKQRGLFAIEDIKKGEFICILPIDYFQLDGKWYTISEHNLRDAIDFRYGILCELDSNKINNQFENFRIFLENKNWKCILRKFDITKIIGASKGNQTTNNFVGHMINDYVNTSFITENKYKKISTEFSNVRVSPKLKLFGTKDNYRLGLKIIATNGIKKGEELYLSYGINYWKKQKEKFIFYPKLNHLQI